MDTSNENEAPPQKKAKKVPKILDGTYFSITSRNDDDHVEARCSECDEVKKGKLSSTGNYITHYRLKHKEKVEKLMQYLKKSIEEFGLNDTKTVKQAPINEILQNTSTDSVSNNIFF